MQKVSVKTVDERVMNKAYYALIEISMGDQKSYCVVVNGVELAVEGVGNDIDKAKGLFDILSAEEVSSVNLDEAIRDMRIEFFV